jgi:hypothetical protein
LAGVRQRFEQLKDHFSVANGEESRRRMSAVAADSYWKNVHSVRQFGEIGGKFYRQVTGEIRTKLRESCPS